EPEGRTPEWEGTVHGRAGGVHTEEEDEVRAVVGAHVTGREEHVPGSRTVHGARLAGDAVGQRGSVTSGGEARVEGSAALSHFLATLIRGSSVPITMAGNDSELR